MYVGTQLRPRSDDDYRLFAQLGVEHICGYPPGPASRSSSSRSVDGWCGTPGGWCSSWPGWPCRECCFRECWSASPSYARRLADEATRLSRGGEAPEGQCAPGGGPVSLLQAAMTIKMDKKGSLRPESCHLFEIPLIDRHRKTNL